MNQSMLKPKRYVFVIWSEQFEEAIASIFVTELREAGIAVKVVGLSPPNAGGAHGLVLVPDLTLEEALPLAMSVTTVILPCQVRGFRRLVDEPRLTEFLHLVRDNPVGVIIGPFPGHQRRQLHLLHPILMEAHVYPPDEQLFIYVRELASTLHSMRPER
jgi:hypothetical protein